jgi:hypothetical protein
MVEIATIIVALILAKLHVLIPLGIAVLIIIAIIKTETGKFLGAVALVGLLWVVAKCAF